MKKIVFCLFIVLTVSLFSFAQESVTVIAIKANVRGIPDSKGIVITTINQGESHELIKQKGPWFLIQTPKYVGWVHGSALKIHEGESTSNFEPTPVYERKPKPRTTTITETQGDTPFKSEYVGGDKTTVIIKNDSSKNMNLRFGGINYSIPANTAKTLEIDQGTYDYSATAPGVRALSGSQGFKQGHLYSWTFYIVTRKY